MQPSDNTCAKEYLEVLQAYFAGKLIEINLTEDEFNPQWTVCEDPWFSSPMRCYRVKKEPVTTKFRLYKRYNAISNLIEISSMSEFEFTKVWKGVTGHIPGFNGWVGDWQVYTLEN